MSTEDDPRMRLAEDARQEVARIDRRISIALLITALLTLAGLFAGALQENILPQWSLVQEQYLQLLEEKATDDWGKQVADRFALQVSQVVVPALGITDRCVSCHNGLDDPRMTDVDQPHSSHPGHYLEWHEASRFGCTICHRGQGRALTFEEAKGISDDWDQPLLPPALTQSGCGLCHSADEVRGQGGELYAQGRDLFTRRGCQSCHKLAGRGGIAGPALDAEGSKSREALTFANVKGPHTLAQFLAEHFDDPQGVVPGSEMKPPQLTLHENLALTIYMLSLQDRSIPASYLSPGTHLELAEERLPGNESGAELFSRYCGVCHDTGRYGRYDDFFKLFIPAIRGKGLLSLASSDYLAENIRRGRPGTRMPPWGEASGGLTDVEIARLVTFIRSEVQPPETAAAKKLMERTLDPDLTLRGDALRGGAIYARHCTGCHGEEGRGTIAPAIANPVFQETASDGFLYATIALGRPDTAMPNFLGVQGMGLVDGDVRDLIAYLRSLAQGGTL